jgi:hypothetical protein
MVITVKCSLDGADDSEHHVGDYEDDYHYGGVLEKTAAVKASSPLPHREPDLRSIMSLRASS